MASNAAPSAPWHHLVSGLASGILSTTILTPVDVVKIRMQVRLAGAGSGSAAAAGASDSAYNTIGGAVRAILRTEGLSGFYKGITPALVGSGASWASYMFMYERAKQRHRSDGPWSIPFLPQVNSDQAVQQPAGRLSTVQHMVCALEAGVATSFMTTPIWLIKARLQLQQEPAGEAAALSGKHRPYRGMFDAAIQIARHEGIRGLYVGLVPALLLTSHGMVQFAAYEELKLLAGDTGTTPAPGSAMEKLSPALRPVLHFCLGAASKVVASSVTYPMQVIKARVQQRPPPGEAPRYSGVVDCAMKTYRAEGVRGLYAGFTANLWRVVPGAAIVLAAHEVVRPLVTAAFPTPVGAAGR